MKAPLLSRIRWFNLGVLALTPAFAIYGAITTKLTYPTAVMSVVGYLITMLGITAGENQMFMNDAVILKSFGIGYHRLWSHRSYVACKPLQIFLAIAGAAAVQGSIKWWARGHRSHHRYTDTDLDPYSALKGIFYCHIGWQIVKPTVKPGATDVSDLTKDSVVRWQHRFYFPLVIFFGYALPALIAWWFWDDARGGFVYASLWRMTAVHHGTFAVNSLAHAFGDTPYDDKHTPRDHIFTAILTLGEGYHNFHHEFPMDYRNAIKWYQYDPTKWFIYSCRLLRLATNLRVFPDNEIKKGELSMQLKRLKRAQDNINWPSSSEQLPIVDWVTFKKESETRPLLVISGFIHDVSDFIDYHPGGRVLIQMQIGKDATAAFFGGVKEHSNAAHNLLSMKRVGILHGGIEIRQEEPRSPPPQSPSIAADDKASYTPLTATQPPPGCRLRIVELQ